MRRVQLTVLTGSLAVLLAGCSTTGGSSAASASSISDAEASDILAAMLSGKSRTQGSELEKALEKASAFPLGSNENPVRVQGPVGQRAYLSRLKCADLKTPKFFRVGNLGPGVYGNIVDMYEVTCPGSSPEKTEVVMDMYHSGNKEDRPIDGFGIAGGRTETSE
ncbi:MAG: hypothetical protein ABJP34_04530 [Erythrobacter sp.]